jgi:hypothetical protein
MMIERMKERIPLVRPLLVPFVAYVAILLLSSNWLNSHPETPWKSAAIALLPMIPGIFIAQRVVRAILQLDEMQRRILLEAAAISFVGTFFLVLSIGLLAQVDVPQLNGTYIGLFMMVLAFLGKLWSSRRYQ